MKKKKKKRLERVRNFGGPYAGKKTFRIAYKSIAIIIYKGFLFYLIRLFLLLISSFRTKIELFITIVWFFWISERDFTTIRDLFFYFWISLDNFYTGNLAPSFW